LQVADLSFAYGEKQVLDNVSFGVLPGQFCALLGPNGAGKSTLIALLVRLFAAPHGNVTIAGHDLIKTPGRALAQLGVVFQQPTLDLSLTVWQNLTYFAALQGLPRTSVTDRIESALTRLDMLNRAHERVGTLNGGHRRRMELARALLHKPTVLILDEPTVGLDAASRAAITDHVHDLAVNGLCVLWATHLPDEVRDDDQLLVLNHGEIIARGESSSLRGALSLGDWFLTKTGGTVA